MRFFSCLFTFAFCLHAAAIAQQSNAVIDVQRYIFDIELNDQNDSINCVATIHYKLLKKADNFSLDLISVQQSGKGMKAYSVLQEGRSLNYTHTNDVITINSDGPIGEKAIKIHYRGIPADGLIISKNKYNHRTFFGDNWPNRARHWLPCVDHPSDKAAVEFRVTAPAYYQVVANGIQVEETNLHQQRKLTHYKEEQPLPMKVTTIGVADFAVQLAGQAGNIPVYSWVYPEDRDKGFYDYGLAAEVLPFFIKNVGPYPYKKLANVQSKTTFGGLENAGAIFYSESSVKGNRSMEELLAHEIAHQWFGNMATEAEWGHLWLSEGFATYMAMLYLEDKYGKDTSQKMRIADRIQVIDFAKKRSAPVVDLSVTNYMDLLNANSYQKGGWILHMLRKQIGDTAFWSGVRTYYTQFAGKNAVTDDLRAAFEKVTGKDLKKFFQQWLYTPGHPLLDITWKYSKSARTLTFTITQQQSTTFDFPLVLNIVAEGSKAVTKSLAIKDKTTTLSIPLAGKPVKVEIDPNIELLHEATLKELQ